MSYPSLILRILNQTANFFWQNFGICLAYGILFTAILLIFTEFNTGTAGETSVTVFKRGTNSSIVQDSEVSADNDDEEALQTSRRAVMDEKSRTQVDLESAKSLADQPKMIDIFSWQNIKYVVPISGGEHRQLLDDVSGYVLPGKLTALMGESGAGKVGSLCKFGWTYF